jgi:hypothetical protein
METIGKEIVAAEGKWLHRIGTEAYFKRAIMGKNGTADFEEVDEVPKFTDAEYSERVNALIRERYDESRELSILRQRYEKPTEFAEYYEYCEACKKRAKAELTARTIKTQEDGTQD